MKRFCIIKAIIGSVANTKAKKIIASILAIMFLAYTIPLFILWLIIPLENFFIKTEQFQKKCLSCGKEINESKFCRFCGAEQIENDKTTIADSSEINKVSSTNTGCLWAAGLFLGALVISGILSKEYGVAAFFVFVFFMIWVGIKSNQRELEQKNNAYIKMNKLVADNGFIINKEILVADIYFKKNGITKFLVDVENKQFAIASYNHLKNEFGLVKYNYSELINFNLFENGTSQIAGRGLAATGGALLFGISGAIIGSIAGDKKIKNICNELSIKIQVNNLQTPLLSLVLLKNSLKTSPEYIKAKEDADQIIATLSYIEANKKDNK